MAKPCATDILSFRCLGFPSMMTALSAMQQPQGHFLVTFWLLSAFQALLCFTLFTSAKRNSLRKFTKSKAHMSHMWTNQCILPRAMDFAMPSTNPTNSRRIGLTRLDRAVRHGPGQARGCAGRAAECLAVKLLWDLWGTMTVELLQRWVLNSFDRFGHSCKLQELRISYISCTCNLQANFVFLWRFKRNQSLVDLSRDFLVSWIWGNF